MRQPELHRWDVSQEEAIEIQKRLRAQLDLQSEPEQIETVASIDVSYNKWPVRSGNLSDQYNPFIP